MLSEKFSSYRLECGLDEAGRGCGSGPVVAGAVILKDGFYHAKLKDSKKMTQRQKLEVFEYIKENSISWSFGLASPSEIDELNILGATMIAMHRAVSGLNIKPEYLIIDGNYFKNNTGIESSTIVKGDSKYQSIAAASVIAKVIRDNIMLELHKDFPQYGWDSNMGYLTKFHLEAVKQWGLCEHHRKTFTFKI